MNDINIGKNKQINHGKYVYHDQSVKGRAILQNGDVRVYRHNCWRADVTLQDCNGMQRIRKRFRTRQEALDWLGMYK